MSTFTVPVVTVKAVITHPNADALDILEFEEIAWKCVDKRGTRKPGDLVVYIPIDSLVDTARPEFSFLAPRAKPNGWCRIKTMRLRGEISQGLVIDAPPSLMQPIPEVEAGSTLVPTIAGLDALYHYGIVKYEPGEPGEPGSSSTFISWCQKTDAERYQNFNRNIAPFANEEFYLTLKMDGTSCTAFYDADRVVTEGEVLNDGYGVCSKNREVFEGDVASDKYFENQQPPTAAPTNTYWRAFRAYSLKEKLQAIAAILGSPKVALQGEICGPGIQKNKAGLKELSFFAFDIFDGSTGNYVPYERFLEICAQLSIPTVPVIGCRPITEDIQTSFQWISSLRYEQNDTPAEGVVFVAKNERFVGNLGRLKFKFINPEFLIKYESRD